MPTASAVVADMIDTAVGRTQITFRTLELWSQREARVKPRDYQLVPGRFYLRVRVDDHPGVLAQIAGVLGSHKISIASVIQHEPETENGAQEVPLVIMTHSAPEGATQTAVAQIDTLPCDVLSLDRLQARHPPNSGRFAKPGAGTTGVTEMRKPHCGPTGSGCST